jgi:hypothetical protein
MRAAALALALVASSAARGDVSLTVTADAPFAPCGSGQRAELKRALADYCERDATADARACHAARRALRCEKISRATRSCASEGSASLSGDRYEQPQGSIELYVNEGCGGSWRIEFEPSARGYRVESVAYDYGSCSP